MLARAAGEHGCLIVRLTLQVSRLRKLVEADAGKPRYIQTVGAVATCLCRIDRPATCPRCREPLFWRLTALLLGALALPCWPWCWCSAGIAPGLIARNYRGPHHAD